MKKEYDYYTLRHSKYGGIDVLGWSTYPKGSVLEGQPMKVFLGAFDTEEEAKKAYPQATSYSSVWTEPQVSLNHLPSENDPVPGGMYPDDYI
jgi:hypothetical protein